MKQGGPGSVPLRLRLAHGTVRAVPAFGSDGSSLESVYLFPYCSQQTATVPVPVRFLQKNGFGGSGSSCGFRANGSDGFGSQFRFGSWAFLKKL